MPQPFYKKEDGLRFKCTRCGNCCTRPGPVYFTADELDRVRRSLSLTPQAIRQKYGIQKDGALWFLDPDEPAACPFYEPESGCSIYALRPTQCRTWPFWQETVHRERSWERAAGECPGMNRGPKHSPEVIEAHLEAAARDGLPEGESW